MKTKTLRLCMVVGSVIFASSGVGLQAGPITYTYTGANFDPSTFRNDGTGSSGDLITFNSSNYVTASVTLDAALPDTSALTNYSSHVLSWSMTVVGAFGKSSANGDSLNDLYFGTTGGNISAWNVFSDDGAPVHGEPSSWQVARIQVSSSTAVTSSQLCNNCVVYDGGLDGSFAQETINNGGSLSPGNWSSPASTVPEPASLATMLGGMTILALLKRNRRNRLSQSIAQAR